jgi:L-ascorbate metabolism protein UlaG (beta-lactamase superfamily)
LLSARAGTVGDLTITAAPGRHAVYEVTFVISAGDRSVYFAGDTPSPAAGRETGS